MGLPYYNQIKPYMSYCFHCYSHTSNKGLLEVIWDHVNYW